MMRVKMWKMISTYTKTWYWKKDDRNPTKNSEIIRFLKIAQLRMKRTAHARENVKNELSMYENMDLKKKMKKIDRLEAEI